MDPNQKLQDTQTAVVAAIRDAVGREPCDLGKPISKAMRAVADQAKHSQAVGELIGQGRIIENDRDLCHELDLAEARIRVLEGQQQNVLELVIARFGEKLRPVIAAKLRLGHHMLPQTAAWHRGYAQALEDFLAGRLTR